MKTPATYLVEKHYDWESLAWSNIFENELFNDSSDSTSHDDYSRASIAYSSCGSSTAALSVWATKLKVWIPTSNDFLESMAKLFEPWSLDSIAFFSKDVQDEANRIVEDSNIVEFITTSPELREFCLLQLKPLCFYLCFISSNIEKSPSPTVLYILSVLNHPGIIPFFQHDSGLLKHMVVCLIFLQAILICRNKA
jgi:hypothetical protein